MAWEKNRPNHVPTRVRDACLARDGNRCTAALRDGTRCPATANLEAAHLTRWIPGEHTTVDMVRTRCSWHHNRETQAEAATERAKRPRPSARMPRESHPGLK